MLGVDPRPFTWWELLRMADGRKQHDWDLASYGAYYFVAPYQEKDYCIFDLHPGYEKEPESLPTISEEADRVKELFQQMED